LGNETVREQRDWTVHPTVLDGQGVLPVVTIPYDSATSTRIDGFTIRGGRANAAESYHGGGIYCRGYAVVANNLITSNTATQYGGGVYLRSGAPILWSNSVTGNAVSSDRQAYGGAGVYTYNCSPTIAANMISTNSATSR
jgi:hypothetical protein